MYTGVALTVSSCSTFIMLVFMMHPVQNNSIIMFYIYKFPQHTAGPFRFPSNIFPANYLLSFSHAFLRNTLDTPLGIRSLRLICIGLIGGEGVGFQQRAAAFSYSNWMQLRPPVCTRMLKHAWFSFEAAVKYVMAPALPLRVKKGREILWKRRTRETQAVVPACGRGLSVNLRLPLAL